eukprot:XP_003723295.1 PREDICTED: carbonyl reductase [NADPH] 3-like [Strongylocentrotus purpuratus]
MTRSGRVTADPICRFQVTGANKGIGFGIVRALCKELGERGVVYLASRDEGRGEKAVQDAAKEEKKKELGWGSSNYGVSKLGVIALTRIQGQDIIKDSGREDILINCCCPGNVATDMSSHKGPLTIDQGAVTPVYLALLPRGCSHQGLFFYQKAVL